MAGSSSPGLGHLMPFTPFHVGPGTLVKGLMPRRFSLSAFALSQVVIDLESLYHLLRHEWPVHRILHTLPVATAAGVITAVVLYFVGPALATPLVVMSRSGLQSELAFWPLILGGFLGGSSHSVLDGVMHSDMRPLLPFGAHNPFLSVVSLTTLHLGCLIAGGVGVTMLVLQRSLWDRTA